MAGKRCKARGPTPGFFALYICQEQPAANAGALNTSNMSEKFSATVSVTIKASREKVWEALTTPALIRKYFFGTNASSDWKVGSPIRFTGEWEGKPYEDKGVILASKRPDIFSYSYWSSMSGLEDKEENYVEITYELKEASGQTELTVTQTSIPDEQMKKHAMENWNKVLDGLKKLLES